ncbi:hypothetical protein RhiirC2_798428, partial [Rhizophagus irregularis]
STGHFSAKCNYCKKFWTRSHSHQLEEHLANNCKKSPELTEQRKLTDWFESTNIPPQKEASIIRALVHVFTCCGISFSIIENPFFIKFFYEMRLGYVPPSRELLGSRLLNQETARMNEKVKKIIEDSENLMLVIDGWTSPNGEFLANEITNIIGKIGSSKVTALVTDNTANYVKT